MNDDYFQEDDEINVECPNCFEDIPVSLGDAEEMTELTCGECGFHFKHDMSGLKRRMNAAMKKIMGKPPKDPNLN